MSQPLSSASNAVLPAQNVRRRQASALIVAGALMFAFVAGWWLWLAPGPTTGAEEPARVAQAETQIGVFPGDVAPDFRLTSLGGGKAALSEHRGHRVLLNFFASWCEPCRAEMPGVQAQAEKHARHDWVVLGVDVMETPEAARAFRDEFDLTFPILLDDLGWVTRTYQVTGTPTSLFIDREGVIAERRLGYMDEAEIAEIIESVP
ncbi:MAG: TlpA disulfide reductase family protein [Chloroflexota bacterium]